MEKLKWTKIVNQLSKQFAEGEEMDLDAILYLIGVQELGKDQKNFKKDEKINLIHVAVCKLLEPYGYYEFDYFDDDGWPHYKIVTELPRLKPGEQNILIKKAIINYFESIDFI